MAGKIRGKHPFSRRHWMVIAFGFVLYYFCNACMSDGMNVIAPRLALERGWEYSYMLSFATLSGCVSVFGQLGFGMLCRSLGPRRTISLALSGAAGFFLLYGLAWSIPVYVAALCGVVTCSSSYAYVGVSALLGNWFPEKKGVASGYSAIGIPASTATSVAAFTYLFSHAGFTPTMAAVSVLLLALAVLGFLFLRDTPEELGEYPDGLPPQERGADREAPAQITPGISLKAMLGIREMWLVGIIFGLFSIVTTGVMGQFVIRHGQAGFSEAETLLLLTACALIGLAGSPILGRLEDALGTLRGFRVCCGVFLAAMLLNFTDLPWLIYASIVCIGIAITGTPIFLMSFLVSIFGRENFKTAYAIAYPLSSLIGQTAFLITGLALRWFGEMRFAYLFFAAMLLLALFLSRFLRMDRWNGTEFSTPPLR